ncbi:hypothetical protein BOTBODRAFT_149656 [Botryobasidium botryosum FD-172 SS1]|uniref:DNA2/NAM7 helicase-like C-terminal domain-containing protein n=1 Tax=Botryobasidium botryosum (strain FD-172 SS1) TaxID=930990 RepID=A0A067LTQ9_BOTB1|nr:hypothetical protein BOTBODRAFT_149656 [Botryobasidium botryosum FD-172 SS1]
MTEQTVVAVDRSQKQRAPGTAANRTDFFSCLTTFFQEHQEKWGDNVSNGGWVKTVKLLQNYRSHLDILNFPNNKFYDGELQAHGSPETINRCLDWGELGGPRNKRFPLIFHGIAGKDLREGRSPSYFNIEEASLVKQYVQKLKRFGLADSDIGVISPYSAQCGKIRTLLSSPEITVGSTEQFQGQERTAIIISTVRSKREEIGTDLRHSLGFLANRRRFNVWHEFMDYIRAGGGWRGLELAVLPADDGDDDDDGNDINNDAHSRRTQGESRLEQLIERFAAGVIDDIDEGMRRMAGWRMPPLEIGTTEHSAQLELAISSP